MPQLFNNQQEFTEAAIKIFNQTKLSDEYDITTHWPDISAFGQYAIGFQPKRPDNLPPEYSFNPDPDIIFYQLNNYFMHVCTVDMPGTWEDPAYSDYMVSDKKFDTLQEAFDDFLRD